MRVVDHAILATGHSLADRVIHEVAREFAGWLAIIGEAPDDSPSISQLVDLHNTDAIGDV